MLQHDKPEDFVIATGETHSVREFCTLAFQYTGIDIEWQGVGIMEKGIDKRTGKTIIEVDPKYFRPTEVDLLLGDPSKAKKLLSWNPVRTPFPKLVKLMVESDMKLVVADERFRCQFD
jgi:GDPmannose 4,6-dehydratase